MARVIKISRKKKITLAILAIILILLLLYSPAMGIDRPRQRHYGSIDGTFSVQD